MDNPIKLVRTINFGHWFEALKRYDGTNPLVVGKSYHPNGIWSYSIEKENEQIYFVTRFNGLVYDMMTPPTKFLRDRETINTF